MGRTPCCEEMGMKKGPWTPEEDSILTSFIQQHGHGNWRALPRLAGLLRCGKSCRLRWVNYLRPDVKHGNFSEDEEHAIISLHGALGNRWSAIAARLPGRTDNEIKNFWHTHLKKRTEKYLRHVTAPRKDGYKGIPETILEIEPVQVPFPLNHTGLLDEQQYQPENSGLGESMERGGLNCLKEDGMDFWYSLFLKAGDRGGRIIDVTPSTSMK